MIEGKNEEMSTSELSGGARIHYIFQSIFVKCLEVSFLSSLSLFWICVTNFYACVSLLLLSRSEIFLNHVAISSHILSIVQSIYLLPSMLDYLLQEVDPCEDLSDEDIRTAIQNATGPKSALFVPDVCVIILLN